MGKKLIRQHDFRKPLLNGFEKLIKELSEARDSLSKMDLSVVAHTSAEHGCVIAPWFDGRVDQDPAWVPIMSLVKEAIDCTLDDGDDYTAALELRNLRLILLQIVEYIVSEEKGIELDDDDRLSLEEEPVPEAS